VRRIVNRFPIFLGGTDRAVELHQLVLELEKGGIVAGRIMFRHRVFLLRAAARRSRGKPPGSEREYVVMAPKFGAQADEQPMVCHHGLLPALG
jgi:hypothetical protein